MKDLTSNRPRVGDLLGGLAGTAVALPQSMGLGVGLFATMGLGASEGALAGLIGATALSLVSGFGGYTRGMISAPNGPVTMLLTASLAVAAANGVSGSGLLATLMVLVMLAGFIQLILGISGGGQLIKFIPYPMVAGMVTAIGILMMGSQLPLLLPQGDWRAWDELSIWAWVPALTAAMTFIAIKLTPRLLPNVPGVIGGLVVGLATFHLCALGIPPPIPEAWVVGAIPSLAEFELSIDLERLGDLDWGALAMFEGLHWDSLLPAALALALLASIDCLVTAVVADSATGARHNARGELAMQGVGQMLAGLFGGIGGGGTKGSTLVAINAGGRRWPAVFAGLTFLSLVIFAGPIGYYLPISVLAGVIFFVGFSMLEWRILLWLRSSRTRIEAVLALVVVASTLYFDLIIGVGIGTLGAVLLFVRGQIRAPMIHDRGTGIEHRSLRPRNEVEHALLDAHGERIVYIELRGDLFFGTVDRLFTELAGDLSRPIWMVFNMRRVQSLDLTSLDLFRQMILRLRSHGGQMLFSNIHRGAANARKMDKLLRAFGGGYTQAPTKTTFKSSDKALESAEDQLLTSLGHPPQPLQARVEIENNSLFEEMDPQALERLIALMQPLTLARKERPFLVGEPGESIYFVLQGVVDLRLPSGTSGTYHYKRLNSVGPGGFFGEISFVDPGPRTASAIVTRDAELMVLSRSQLERLNDPTLNAAVMQLLLRLSRPLVRHLRRARAEVARLAKW